MKKQFVILISLIAVLFVCACSNKINSTDELMSAISERYNGKWFKNIKFTQTTNFYHNDSIVKTERWIEEYLFPSQLIIKVNHENSPDGYLYRNDSVYTFEDGKIAGMQKITHDLVILSMDIYNMSKNDIMQRIEDLEYDWSKFHQSLHNGRKIYVLGANKGDSLSNQVWFDAEYLYFVKMIKNTDKGYQEVELKDYISIDGQGWIEQEIIFKLNGKVYMVEKYYNIQIPQKQKTEIVVSDFANFNLSVDKAVQYVLEYTVYNQGKRFLIMWSDAFN